MEFVMRAHLNLSKCSKRYLASFRFEGSYWKQFHKGYIRISGKVYIGCLFAS